MIDFVGSLNSLVCMFMYTLAIVNSISRIHNRLPRELVQAALISVETDKLQLASTAA